MSKEGRIDIGGRSLGFALSGRGERVITLLHGLASTKDTWDVVVQAVAEHARVLCLDMRGHGDSDSPDGAWTLRDLGLDVVAALDALAIERTVLVGHSGGGVVALEVAVRSGQRLSALVVAAAASQANERAARWYEDMARKAEEHGGASVLPDFGWPADARAPQATGFAKAARCMATLHPRPLTPELAAITCPTTLIVGSADFIGAGGTVIMSRAIPGSRLEILEGRGHALHREDPATFTRLVLETCV